MLQANEKFVYIINGRHISGFKSVRKCTLQIFVGFVYTTLRSKEGFDEDVLETVINWPHLASRISSSSCTGQNFFKAYEGLYSTRARFRTRNGIYIIRYCIASLLSSIGP